MELAVALKKMKILFKFDFRKLFSNYKTYCLALYIISIIVYIAFSLHSPIYINMNAKHDDAWYVTKGISIFTGQWLGKYDQYTLIKGVFYPIFLSVNFAIGSNVIFFQAALYISSVLFFIKSLEKFNVSSVIKLGIFLFLLLDPYLISVRIIRDNVYTSLTLIVYSAAFYLYGWSDKIRTVLFIFLGSSFGCFLITREEGVWIFPFMLFMLFVTFFYCKKENLLLPYFINLGVFLFFSFFPLALVAFLNNHFYGVSGLNEIKSTGFSKAYNLLTSVNVHNQISYVPVPEKTRKELYKVSPAFQELEQFLDGVGSLKANNFWLNISCKSQPSTCGDYSGGVFLWALRDAVAKKGYYSSPSKAEDYYNRLVSEINTACTSAIVSRDKKLFPIVPKLPEKFFNSLVQTVSLAIKKTLRLTNEQSSVYRPSSGLLSDYPLNFLGFPRYRPEKMSDSLSFGGYYYSTDSSWIYLTCPTYDGVEKKIIVPERKPSSDVNLILNESDEQKYRLNINEVDANCNLIFENNSSLVELKSLSLGRVYEKKIPKSVLHIDYIKKNALLEVRVERLKNFLLIIYRNMVPVLAISGFILFIFCFLYFRENKMVRNLVILSMGLWIAYISRILVLSLVHITSFDGLYIEYMKPAYLTLNISSMLSIASFFLFFRKNNK